MSTKDNWESTTRLGGLRRFAVAITVLNILGHSVFGFEQSFAHPLVALATAYSIELLLEWIDSRTKRRRPIYAGGLRQLVDFLLSAHITGMAVSMLTYANERLGTVVFATTVALCSKAILRIPAGKGTRHLFNPSNFGITVTLLLFPRVGIAPPYQFTEWMTGYGDWLLPFVIVLSGTFLNARFTHRLPLIAAWLSGFLAQALVRHLLLETSFTAALMPMTGMAFILYTFYMVTDPATTPDTTKLQILYGIGVAAVYGLLMAFHIVFGLFFALTIVCAIRGVVIFAKSQIEQRVAAEVPLQARITLKEY